MPEVVAVAEFRKAPGGDPLEKAVEDAEGDVLPVGGTASDGAESGLGELGEASEITLPEEARSLVAVSGPEVPDPLGDGILAIGGHENTPSVLA